MWGDIHPKGVFIDTLVGDGKIGASDHKKKKKKKKKKKIPHPYLMIEQISIPFYG